MTDARTRLQQIHRVVNDPPPVHGAAAGATRVWGASLDCYAFLARHVEPGARTLETGCGISTALFALWGTEHTCVVYSQQEVDILRAWCAERDIDLSRLSFAVGPSDEILPSLDRTELDLTFIDGSHAFPAAIIDWFYAGGRLREGGTCVLDDVHLLSVTLGLFEFLAKDPRWELVARTDRWAACVRRGSGTLREEWTDQQFLT